MTNSHEDRIGKGCDEPEWSREEQPELGVGPLAVKQEPTEMELKLAQNPLDSVDRSIEASFASSSPAAWREQRAIQQPASLPTFPKSCGLWRGFTHSAAHQDRHSQFSAPVAVKIEEGAVKVSGSPSEAGQPPKVPPTFIKKERSLSREEWRVVANPDTQPQPKPQPARMREVWTTVSAAASLTTPPRTPPSGSHVIATDGMQRVGQNLQLNSPDAKSARKQVNEESVKKEKISGEGDMSHYFGVTPLSIMKEDIDLFTPEQRAVIREKAKNLKDPYPQCSCPDGAENGPCYTQLGHAASLQALRSQLETRLLVSGRDLRIVTVKYSGVEGKTQQNCPVAKWIIRRSSYNEKILVVAKVRPGHCCDYVVTVGGILMYEALGELADRAYTSITGITSAQLGETLRRQCGKNSAKTCLCQGTNQENEGQSYTFGCSWSLYNHSACKFSKSYTTGARKFRITGGNQAVVPAEEELETICHQLADQVAPLHRLLAPDSFNNMCLFEEAASDCRLGRQPGRPYSGITTVVDFCAHSHRDTTNMIGGCTAILTLTKPENRQRSEPAEEQFHVLPMYVPDLGRTDLAEAEACGGITVLDRFRKKVVLGQKESPNCKRRTPKRKAGESGPSPRKLANVLPAPLRPENQFHYAIQQLAFSNPSGLGVPENNFNPLAAAWFLPPGGGPFSDDIGGATSGLPGGQVDEDFGSGEKLESQSLANLEIYESDCQEAFRNQNMGGVAFSLPHGSLLLEVAKHELHATTALRNPDRTNPCRIGLVFYQHRSLHYPHHGSEIFVLRREQKEHWRYISWLNGTSAPTEPQQRTLIKSGFVFPPGMRFKANKTTRLLDQERFYPEEFPTFCPGKWVRSVFFPIRTDMDGDLAMFNERVSRHFGELPDQEAG